MENVILKSQYKFYINQANELVSYFNNKFSDLPKCDGRQYPQIITCLNALYKKEHSIEELKEIITDGDGDAGLADAFIFTDNSVDIFDFKESANLRLRDIQKISVQLKRLIFNKPNSYDADDIRRIKQHLIKFHSSKNKRPNFNIYIVRSKFVPFTKDIKQEIREIEKNASTKIIPLTNKEVINHLLEQDFLKTWVIRKSNIKVLLSDKSEENYDYLIINIPLKELLSLYKLHLEEGIDLFAQNIRVPQKKKKFTEGISETVEKYSKSFFLFHNGITITASNINANATNFLINEPQVVNGAQTLGNLFNKYKGNLKEKKLKEAAVLCKIVKAKQEMTDLVCETSNTQKAVKIEDLRTNDSFQKKLSLYIKSESKGMYEYVRKGNKKIKGSVAIKYTKFFQWVYAAIFYKPAEAKNAKKSLFETDERGEYENIKNLVYNNLTKIIFLCDVGVFVENFIKGVKNKQKKGLLKSCDLHIVAALFLLKSTKVEKLNKIYQILKNYSEVQIKKDRSLNNNKIFTKSSKAWGVLKSKILKK